MTDLEQSINEDTTSGQDTRQNLEYSRSAFLIRPQE
jgi:hypothetical protein